MRALIVLSLTAIIFGSTACQAGMSTGPHKVLASTAMATTAPATAAPRAAPVAKRVAVIHRREARPVHYASSNPIAVVGGAIGNTLGAIFHR